MRRWPQYTIESVSRLTRAQILGLLDEEVTASDVLEFKTMEDYSRWLLETKK